MTTFDRAFAYLMREEGGYSLDPRDPGGETKFGISKRAYPDLDIKGLTLEQAKAIYERDYWLPLGCDSRPYREALPIFDCGVNQGLGRAREILGRVQAGPDFVARFQAERALHYAQLSTFQRFGRGWMRRLIRCALEANRDAP